VKGIPFSSRGKDGITSPVSPLHCPFTGKEDGSFILTGQDREKRKEVKDLPLIRRQEGREVAAGVII